MIDSHRDEIAKLESLYAMNPDGRVFAHLADACRKAGQLERAQQILEDGLDKHPDYASAHVVLGRVFADAGRDEPAVAEFRRVLELDRHNLIALRSLGELAARAGRTDEAIHYYSELAVLDPTDPEIQNTMRGLRDRVGEAPGATSAAAPASRAVPESEDDVDVGERAAAESESAESDESQESPAGEPTPAIEIETHEAAAMDSADIAPMAGLESARAEPEPESIWPESGERDLPEWPEPDAGAVADQPGEAPALDEAAWREIAAGGESAGTDPAAPDEPTETDEPAASPEAGWSTEETESETGATDRSADDETEAGPAGAETDPLEVEGRWQVPGSSVADAQAEANRPTDHSAEWIPSERWHWMAASADTPGSPPGDQVEDDAIGEEDGDESLPDESRDSPGAVFDAEVSFAGLAGDPDDSVGDSDEVSFAGLTDDGDDTLGPDSDEASFAGLADFEPEVRHDVADRHAHEADEAAVEEADEYVYSAGPADSEPVDSFEEGAAAVLDAFSRAGDEPGDSADPTGDEREGEGVSPEHEPSPATWGREPEDDEAPISWVTDASDDGDLVITETLAEIYASQGLYDRAAAVYRRLIEQHPDEDRLKARLADLESATGWAGQAGEGGHEAGDDAEAFLERVESAWTGGHGAAGTEDTPYAWSEPTAEEAEDGPTAGEYFGALLAWRPSEAVPSTASEPATDSPAGMVEDWYAEEAERAPDVEAGGEGGREGEEDLEMFRSWLKSLKK